MIVLTRRNHEKFLVNHLQIEIIKDKIARYNAKVMDIQREITVVDKR